jgi:hypothetical protein
MDSRIVVNERDFWEDHTCATPFERYEALLETILRKWMMESHVGQEYQIKYEDLGIVLLYIPAMKSDSKHYSEILYGIRSKVKPWDLVNGMGILTAIITDQQVWKENRNTWILSGLYLAICKVGWMIPVFVSDNGKFLNGRFVNIYWSCRPVDMRSSRGSLLTNLCVWVYSKVVESNRFDSDCQELFMDVYKVHSYSIIKSFRVVGDDLQPSSIEEEYSRLMSRLMDFMQGDMIHIYEIDENFTIELEFHLEGQIECYVLGDNIEESIKPKNLIIRTIKDNHLNCRISTFCRSVYQIISGKYNNKLSELLALEDQHYNVDYHRSILNVLVGNTPLESNLEILFLYMFYCYCLEERRVGNDEYSLAILISVIWTSFIELLKSFWNQGISMGPKKVLDMNSALICQKLEFLNQCILELNSQSPKHYDQVQILNGTEVLLNHPDINLYVPFTQEYPKLTSDRAEENLDVIARLFDEDEGKKTQYQSKKLVFDIQAFKATNPHACFEDFIRWYSPKDWDESTKSLSQRMKSAGVDSQSNLWIKLWDSLASCSVSEQPPLFDYKREGERILYELTHETELFHISELFPHIINALSLHLDRFVRSNRILRNFQIVSDGITKLLNMITIFPWNSQESPVEELLESMSNVEKLVSQVLGLYRMFPNFSFSSIEELLENCCLAVVHDSEDAEGLLELFRDEEIRLLNGERYCVRARTLETKRIIHQCFYSTDCNDNHLLLDVNGFN